MATHFYATQLRDSEIHNDKVRRHILELVQCLLPVSRDHYLKVLELQIAADEPDHGWVILDNLGQDSTTYHESLHS